MKTIPTAQPPVPGPAPKPRVIPLVATLLLLALPPGTQAEPAPAAPPAVATTPAADSYRLPADAGELLRLDNEMRAFFAARVGRDTPGEERLTAILAAIVGADGLNFRYEEFGLYDVREAFRRRRGNCLTISALIVAVAREFRMPARFNNVPVRPSWSRVGRIVLEENHVNVRIETAGVLYEIDFGPRLNRAAPRGGGRLIGDRRACATLYSNAGVYRLISDDLAGALRFMQLATQTDPTYAAGWTNLAGAHQIAHDPAGARRCYERALATDPAHLAAIDGLARLSREAGDTTRAEKLERKVARYRERNPYHLLQLARGELAEGDVQGAHRHLSRAVRLKDDDPEILAALVEASRRLGRNRESSRWARRLAALPRLGPPRGPEPQPSQARLRTASDSHTGPAPSGP